VSEPDSDEPEAAPTDGDTASEAEGGRAIREGLATLGQALGRAAVQLGTTVADAYASLDPDLKRHLAQMPLVGLTMLAPGRAKVEARGKGDAPAVIFVHGLGGSQGNFLPMLAYFWWEGMTRTYAVRFEERTSLEAMALELRALVAEVAAVNGLEGDDTVDLVAHSMGGLVCRLALEDGETSRRVRRLVTLGTPHCGTHVARYLASQSGLALRPESDILARLDAQIPWAGPPSLPEATALWSRADVLLLPPEAGQLEGAQSLELPEMTHYGFLLHPRGWKTVFGLVVTGPKQAPGQTDGPQDTLGA
jgi:pimeloyl-ACP methyl ester carboxylesterase